LLLSFGQSSVFTGVCGEIPAPKLRLIHFGGHLLDARLVLSDGLVDLLAGPRGLLGGDRGRAIFRMDADDG
jgi:hypothetical protein